MSSRDRVGNNRFLLELDKDLNEVKRDAPDSSRDRYNSPPQSVQHASGYSPRQGEVEEYYGSSGGLRRIDRRLSMRRSSREPAYTDPDYRNNLIESEKPVSKNASPTPVRHEPYQSKLREKRDEQPINDKYRQNNTNSVNNNVGNSYAYSNMENSKQTDDAYTTEVDKYKDNNDHVERENNTNRSLVRDGDRKPKAKVPPVKRNDNIRYRNNGISSTLYPDGYSNRAKYYQTSSPSDTLLQKVCTQLREHGVAETRVNTLAGAVCQAVRDDVLDTSSGSSPQINANLREAINKHLDPLLFNKEDATDLRDADKPGDTPNLSHMMLMRLSQVHEEIDTASRASEDPKMATRKHNNYTSNRDPDRSQLSHLKENIDRLRQENEILQDKLDQSHRETEDIEAEREKSREEINRLDAENWKLAQDLHLCEEERESFWSRAKELQRENEGLERTNQKAKEENQALNKALEERDTEAKHIAKELARLQSENGRLKVLSDQRQKEILHSQEPDRELLHRVNILKDENALLHTKQRRTGDELSLLKARSQRIESSLEEAQKARNKLASEKEGLFKENTELKQKLRRLTYEKPRKTPRLPDINTGSNGPSRSSYSRSSRMTTHKEDEVTTSIKDKQLTPV